MLAKERKSRAREGIQEPLEKALVDLSRSLTALHKAVAALCGKAATGSRKRCAARQFRLQNVR